MIWRDANGGDAVDAMDSSEYQLAPRLHWPLKYYSKGDPAVSGVKQFANYQSAFDIRVFGSNYTRVPNTLLSLSQERTGDAAWFTTRDHATPSYVRNPNCVLRNVDLTCVSPWNSGYAGLRCGTAITPRHIVYADHYPIGVSRTIRFVTNDNTVVTRTISSQAKVSSTDIMIGTLDSDLPATIKPAVFMPDGYFSLMSSVGRPYLLVWATNQNKVAIARRVAQEGSAASEATFSGTLVPSMTGYNVTIINGDSGNPIFVPIGGRVALLSCWHTAFTGPNHSKNLTAIAAITNTYPIEILDLSGLTNG